MYEKIIELRNDGLTYREIAKKVGCSLGKVTYWLNPSYREKILKKSRDNYTPKKRVKAEPDNPQKAKARMLKHRYGITMDEYNRMYSEQNGCCAICEDPKPLGGPSGLYVDHDHKTGKVRGLLCTSCNSAIGKLKEDPKVINNALQYLNEHKG